jgi:hypothetical protein
MASNPFTAKAQPKSKPSNPFSRAAKAKPPASPFTPLKGRENGVQAALKPESPFSKKALASRDKHDYSVGGIKIHQLREHDGYWTIAVSNGPTTVYFHNKYGSWLTDNGDGYKEARKEIAFALQARWLKELKRLKRPLPYLMRDQVERKDKPSKSTNDAELVKHEDRISPYERVSPADSTRNRVRSSTRKSTKALERSSPIERTRSSENPFQIKAVKSKTNPFVPARKRRKQ